MKLLLYATLLVALCFSTLAFGGKPPPRLMEQLHELFIVHDQYCKIDSMRIVDRSCLIYYDKAEDTVYVVLFDDDLGITHVISEKGKEEMLLWCHFKVCV